ncbi:hypothetical protein [Pseudomonas sp. TE21394]
MAKQVINLGSAPNGAGGDDRRSAWLKAIANFDELYNWIATGFQKSNILGAVSQAGGVPTGALLQRGSNANGEFIRLADGTQICWGVITLPKQALGSSSVGRSNFPAVFAAVPRVFANPLSSVGASGDQSAIGQQAYNGVWWGASTTFAEANSWSYRFATNADIQYQYLAIGRWF